MVERKTPLYNSTGVFFMSRHRDYLLSLLHQTEVERQRAVDDVVGLTDQLEESGNIIKDLLTTISVLRNKLRDYEE
ncbi:hypothetical protein SEA_CECE_207 [Microbacterium phage Cece]|nr:hypothetical protein SEA_CECE_207 [Microbacterium phage Cece]